MSCISTTYRDFHDPKLLSRSNGKQTRVCRADRNPTIVDAWAWNPSGCQCLFLRRLLEHVEPVRRDELPICISTLVENSVVGPWVHSSDAV